MNKIYKYNMRSPGSVLQSSGTIFTNKIILHKHNAQSDSVCLACITLLPVSSMMAPKAGYYTTSEVLDTDPGKSSTLWSCVIW